MRNYFEVKTLTLMKIYAIDNIYFWLLYVIDKNYITRDIIFNNTSLILFLFYRHFNFSNKYLYLKDFYEKI